ncbi:dihydrodipicolinate synthase family protein [Pseudofrankia sp. BMG5.37]|uniref:dihydrodipicolinate synthase family protein n=1 Tax=Pseudofrankia sp. BMG5.37 TaxID=3050035 RepID=UPI00289533E0|nr:dihydrodipicolinate synthase family protein [Pseudofrankia sp. BMG5.37]MDT3444526.1 dihydrodipicolinate synthase family protein [Pseudofrankia sp. BMG5.37]
MRYARSEAKEAARKQFTGLWAATTTPFTTDGRLDQDAIAADLERLTRELHVGGVFCAGVMGEFWALSADERKEAVEAVVRAASGACPVLAHTGDHSAATTIELTRHAEQIGADFAVVINPYYPPASAAGLRAWYQEVLSSVDIGVWLFDTSYSGVTLPMDLIDELADVENVCGIKVGHDHARYLETLARVGDRILVCEANEATWLENIRDHGQTVYMSSALPYLFQTASSQPMREYTELALGGEFDKAAEVAATLEPLRALGSKWLHGQWVRDRILPIPFIKAWAGLLGMSGGDPRVPLLPLTDRQRAELTADLAAAGLI